MASKLVSLQEAVSVVQNGDIVAFGGIVESRRPMAAMREIVKQRKQDLILLSTVSVDDFVVGAGCAAALRGCYTHMGIFGKAPCVHRKLASKEFIVDEVGHHDCLLQVMGPSYGLPYIASPYCLGSDIINPDYDYSEQLRAVARNPHKIPKKKYIFTENLFSDEHEKVVLLAGIKPDVAIIHVGVVGTEGTVRMEGTQGIDQFYAFAADKVIITADEIVPERYIRSDPSRNNIPSTEVDMVVHVPWGAHPSASPGYYEFDMEALFAYQAAARTEEGFDQWVKEWIDDVESHTAYLEKVGVAKMQQLTAVKPFGFRPRTPDIDKIV